MHIKTVELSVEYINLDKYHYQIPATFLSRGFRSGKKERHFTMVKT
jgi:hypothetical protein